MNKPSATIKQLLRIRKKLRRDLVSEKDKQLADRDCLSAYLDNLETYIEYGALQI